MALLTGSYLENGASGWGVHMYNPVSTDAGGDVGAAYGVVTRKRSLRPGCSDTIL